MGKLWVVVAMGAMCSLSQAANTPALERLDFRQVVRESKDRVFPSLIFLKCLRETHEFGKKVSGEVSGSGVLISDSGELLTNWHVVDKATDVRCLLSDGRTFAADVIGTDKDLDLALVKLRGVKGKLPVAELGESSVLTEGDFVMAMGAPWGMSRSVSIGIVSCPRRFMPANSEYTLWIQTDASISPGNSGGPLVNTDGRIVGINAMGAMQGGDMGFALPSDVIAQVLPQLRQAGRVRWAWTGLRLQPLRDFDRNTYFEADSGVIVASTDPESPARRAGIQQRDRIVSVAGRSISGVTAEDLPDIRRYIGLLPIGEPVKVELVRDGKLVTVELTPREKGLVEGEELDCPRWDLTLKAINEFDNPNLYFFRKKGVFIYGVKHPGNATVAGLLSNDIVTHIDGKPVTTLEEARQLHADLVSRVQDKSRVMLTVLRNGGMRQVILDFSRDYERD